MIALQQTTQRRHPPTVVAFRKVVAEVRAATIAPMPDSKLRFRLNGLFREVLNEPLNGFYFTYLMEALKELGTHHEDVLGLDAAYKEMRTWELKRRRFAM